MPDQMVTSDDPESLPVEGGNGETKDWRAEATRLQQQLAEARNLNRQAIPLVNLAYALKQAPGGAEIIAKLEKGEPLTAKQEATVQRTTEAESARTGISMEQLQEALQNFEQRLVIREQSKLEMQALNERAAKELEGFEELSRTAEWKNRLKVILAYISEGAIEVPDEEADPYYFAIKETYDTIRAKNPDIGKLKRAPKSESERKGAIVKASPRSAGAPEAEEEISEDRAFARRPIRRPGIGGVGRSLQELRHR